MDITRATELTTEVNATVEDIFQYHPWDQEQQDAGGAVRRALADAVKVILVSVPPCPTRSVAIRKIIEARMDCNAAITHRGKY